MKRFSKIRLSKPIILGSLGIVAGVSFFVCIILTQPYQTSRGFLDQKCQDFYNDLAIQLAAVENYRIEKSVKDCHTIQDEMGSTDYSLSVKFKISRNEISEAKVDKDELEQFSQKLPLKTTRFQ